VVDEGWKRRRRWANREAGSKHLCVGTRATAQTYRCVCKTREGRARARWGCLEQKEEALSPARAAARPTHPPLSFSSFFSNRVANTNQLSFFLDSSSGWCFTNEQRNQFTPRVCGSGPVPTPPHADHLKKSTHNGGVGGGDEGRARSTIKNVQKTQRKSHARGGRAARRFTETACVPTPRHCCSKRRHRPRSRRPRPGPPPPSTTRRRARGTRPRPRRQRC
jgi:hypothetical protein